MPLNDIQKWQAENLSRLGFSHKAISRYVHHRKGSKSFTTDDERDLACVKYHLRKHGLKVTDWREMRTPHSNKAARDACKLPAKRRSKSRKRTGKRRGKAAA